MIAEGIDLIAEMRGGIERSVWDEIGALVTVIDGAVTVGGLRGSRPIMPVN